MISMAFFFRKLTPDAQMNLIVQECNEVLRVDFGPLYQLDSENPPDLLVIGRDSGPGSKDETIGLLTLHHTDASRVWELGTMSAQKPHTHDKLFDLFMGHLPRILQEQRDTYGAEWLVKRVAQKNKAHINRLTCMGFAEPAHFLIGVLSNEGYVPFDPFEEVLMKRRLSGPRSEAISTC
jgi:hypothetical protein